VSGRPDVPYIHDSLNGSSAAAACVSQRIADRTPRRRPGDGTQVTAARVVGRPCGRITVVVGRGNAATVITTGRLVVRPWRLDEADRFFDVYRRPEVVGWLGGEPMQDRGEAMAMIERNLARLDGDSRFGSWAVVDRLTGVPVGSVILKPLPDGEGEVEIGWQLHPDSWGNGFASEAASAVLERGVGCRTTRSVGGDVPRQRSLRCGLPADRDAAARHHPPLVPRAEPDVLDRFPIRSGTVIRARPARAA
jgi:RimJ/RimL family protein N-acetyltransferase